MEFLKKGEQIGDGFEFIERMLLDDKYEHLTCFFSSIFKSDGIGGLKQT